MSFWKRLLLVCAAAAVSLSSLAQNQSEQVDSLVSLLSAKSMQLIEKQGVSCRKVTGPARFFHNNTYLLCDTALWNVNTKQIDAIGNVRLLQESTVLSSDKLIYLIEQDLAQFRGTLVQLEDKEGNVLRTNYLDYNTKDSVAVFMGGASMKDKDGQIIESLNGNYDSKIKTFTFSDNVNMFSDSIFVKTTRLVYDTDRNFAEFGTGTDTWRDEAMLSSDAGWYDRSKELFFFTDNVHGMNEDKEMWSDSLFFYRNTSDVEMMGNVQLVDTTRNATALAGHLLYVDSLSQVTLTVHPSVIAVTDTTGTAMDSLFVGGDLLRMKTVQMFRVDTLEKVAAQKRQEYMAADAVGAFKKKVAEDARIAAENARMKTPEYMAEQQAKLAREAKESGSSAKVLADSTALKSMEDSLALKPLPDSLVTNVLPDSLSLQVPTDSLSVETDVDSLSVEDVVPTPLDTAKIAFISAYGRVKLYREDFQMVCDTLKFNTLDSLVRLYSSPIVWNEGNRQYASDSLYVAFGENNLDKAYLMSNAFVTIEEAPKCYDQIRSTEMLAFFDEDGGLRRFDAMGGVDAIFFFKEDSTFATVNKSQSKLLTAVLKDGTIDTVSYYEEPKNDAFPLAQLNVADRTLKGFNWTPELRPSSPDSIVRYTPRVTEREAYLSRPKAKFRETDTYFPGYMTGVYREIEEKKQRAAERKARQDSIAVAADTVVIDLTVKDSLSVEDSHLTVVDSLKADTAADSLATVTAEPKQTLSPRALKKVAKVAEREARWARLDSLDAARISAKEELKAERARQKKLKTIETQMEQERKDAEKLQKYILRFEKRRNRKRTWTKDPDSIQRTSSSEN